MEGRWPESRTWVATAAAALIPRAVSARSAAREKSFHPWALKAAGTADEKGSVASDQNCGAVDGGETAVPEIAATMGGARRDPIGESVCARTAGRGASGVDGVCAQGKSRVGESQWRGMADAGA